MVQSGGFTRCMLLPWKGLLLIAFLCCTACLNRCLGEYQGLGYMFYINRVELFASGSHFAICQRRSTYSEETWHFLWLREHHLKGDTSSLDKLKRYDFNPSARLSRKEESLFYCRNMSHSSRGIEDSCVCVLCSRVICSLFTRLLCVFRKMNRLRIVNLSGNDIQQLPGKVFRGASSIQTLDLMDNALTLLEDGMFIGLDNLKVCWEHACGLPWILHTNGWETACLCKAVWHVIYSRVLQTGPSSWPKELNQSVKCVRMRHPVLFFPHRNARFCTLNCTKKTKQSCVHGNCRCQVPMQGVGPHKGCWSVGTTQPTCPYCLPQKDFGQWDTRQRSML